MQSVQSNPTASTPLDVSDLETFLHDGLLVHRWRLRDQYVRLLLDQLPILARRGDTVAFEEDGQTRRALHGGFQENVVFDRLTRLDTVLGPVEQILQDRAYVYQFKVNLKAAFNGDLWPWHQDYSFWAKEDEMPAPRALTVAIFLDDVTEFNGPVYFIPGSHRTGCHDQDEAHPRDGGDATWLRHVAASLSYQTKKSDVASLAALRGIVAPKGPPGTILFFDCNIVHASPANISPMDRRIVFITYNSIANAPRNIKRPAFLVNQNTSPLEQLTCTEFIEPM